jgi:hypothetical protein
MSRSFEVRKIEEGVLKLRLDGLRGGEGMGESFRSGWTCERKVERSVGTVACHQLRSSARGRITHSRPRQSRGS